MKGKDCPHCDGSGLETNPETPHLFRVCPNCNSYYSKIEEATWKDVEKEEFYDILGGIALGILGITLVILFFLL